ncbi:MAG: valine--tRNA ligase [Pseudomonadota bacterium]
MIDKTFIPRQIEEKWSKRWIDDGGFAPYGEGEAYTIMMPPPNVTGRLHVGHALTMTLQDILTRYARRRGRATLWQPGTDHASIATQMMVERALYEQEQRTRQDLGRDAFLNKVWAFSQDSQKSIISQLQNIGASADWSRLRFTLDEDLSRAVRHAFVRLHRDGLIYQDQRMVNWDPELQTAISDLEVEQRSLEGQLWSIRYPLADGKGEIIVATTRPETMFGDTAIAVHPEDERYRHLIGRKAILPLTARHIEIIQDSEVDPQMGTGAVKITPAHAFPDFEIGRRHGLESVVIMDKRGRMTDAVPEGFEGLDRFAARKKVIDRLGDEVVAQTKIVHHVPHGDRSGVPLEPYLTTQWYCDSTTLAKPAIKALHSGRIRFIPSTWDKTYLGWLENIQPWCISRQLWWGHRIPAWYGPDDHVFIAEDEAQASKAAREHYGKDTDLRQDDDVLDTWFSSALWPFSTLGWPQQTPDLNRHYPGDVLITGFDIIFFWVARMVMMGLYFCDEVPFSDIYIHALVRDRYGQKMSKTKGNVIDPMDLTKQYGTDSVRFYLASLSTPGRDIRLNPDQVEGYRHFATKLWNAARYAQGAGAITDKRVSAQTVKVPINRWILRELASTIETIEESFQTYRFDLAAQSIYQFCWHRFCDWYIEFSKTALTRAGADSQETKEVMGWVLLKALGLLNPFMPHLTEELTEALAPDHPLLLRSGWPDPPKMPPDDPACGQVDWLVDVAREVRRVRTALRVPAKNLMTLQVVTPDDETRQRIDALKDILIRQARLEKIQVIDSSVATSMAARFTVLGCSYALPLEGVVNIADEKQRLEKTITAKKQDIEKIEKKLNNSEFRAKAPERVIKENELRLHDLQNEIERMESALSLLT